MSIDAKANEITAENSALVCCEQRSKPTEMKGSKKKDEQCKWLTTFPENRTSKSLNWYMSQDNYEKNPWEMSNFVTRTMESFLLAVLLSSFPAIISSSCVSVTQIAFLSQEGAVF